MLRLPSFLVRSLATAALMVGAGTTLDAARAPDTLVMTNGDRIIGEVKKLQNGELYFKAPYMQDDMRVDWNRVAELRGPDPVQVLLVDGRILAGPLERKGNDCVVGEPREQVGCNQLITVVPLERGFFSQLDGYVNYGFDYTSGSEQTQSSFSAGVEYLAQRYAVKFDGSSVFSGQEDAVSTTRNTFTNVNELTLGRKWYLLSLFDLLRSDQQDLELRTTIGGGLGHAFFRTGTVQFVGLVGSVFTTEQYAASAAQGEDDNQNLELLFGLSFSAYQFKTTRVTVRFLTYPNLTTPGRVRLSFTPNLYFDFGKNLTFGFQLYENYDSHPPVSAAKNDFGITSSFGWTF